METDKKTAFTTASSVENGEKSFEDPQWKTGVIARFPWVGFGALFTILLCTAGAVIVLLFSDDKSQLHWHKKIAPNVILSGLNSVANICFGVAIGNGVPIAWWRQTLKGATIKDLHRSWKFSSSIKDIILGGKYFNFIALAALAAKLTIIDSMLLQRATTTEIKYDIGHNVTVRGYANDTMPFTAQIGDRSGDISFLNGFFRANLNYWSRTGGSFPNVYENCNGTCVLDIPGVGFEIDCSTNTTSMDYGNVVFKSALANSQASSLNMSSSDEDLTAHTLFNVAFEVQYRSASSEGDYSKIIMNVLSTSATNNEDDDGSSAPSCPGTVTNHTCSLRPAVIRYPVTVISDMEKDNKHPISNMFLGYNTSSFEGIISSSASTSYNAEQKQQDGYVVLGYNDVLEEHITIADSPDTAIGGIWQALTHYFAGHSDMQFDGVRSRFSLSQTGLSETKLTQAPTGFNQCGFAYEDPLDYLVQQINSLMFTLAIDPFQVNYDHDTSSQTPFNATQYGTSVHYKTNQRFMWGAVASTVFCVLCVLPSYYGYWQLGRDVTLGPFEIANAFRAPVLDHPKVANAEVNELIKEVGGREVKYGEIINAEAAGRLAIAEPDSVRRVHPSVRDRSRGT